MVILPYLMFFSKIFPFDVKAMPVKKLSDFLAKNNYKQDNNYFRKESKTILQFNKLENCVRNLEMSPKNVSY